MMTTEDLAELDIIRSMPNEVLSAQGILDFLDGTYMAYADMWDSEADVPEVVLTVGGLPMIISEALNMPNDKYRILEVHFEDSSLWRTCYIKAEYAE